MKMDEKLYDIGGGNMLPTIWAMEPIAMAQLVATMQQRFASGQPFVGAGPIDDAARRGLPIRNAGSGTALISLNGPMTKGETFMSFFGYGTSTDALRAAFTQARNDKDIHSILFKVTSPGGSVDSIAELADTIAEVALEKNVVAQVEGMAASAAFLVASQARKIFSGRGDMIGSIGTKMHLLDFSEAFKDAGIKSIDIDTGPFKSIGSPGSPVTEEQIEHLQSLVDAHFEIFIEAVVHGRKKMSEKSVRAVADGRMFMAKDAVSNGLIDGISTLEKTLFSLQKQGNAALSSRIERTKAVKCRNTRAHNHRR